LIERRSVYFELGAVRVHDRPPLGLLRHQQGGETWVGARGETAQRSGCERGITVPPTLLATADEVIE
jgi:hypothetical protein